MPEGLSVFWKAEKLSWVLPEPRSQFLMVYCAHCGHVRKDHHRDYQCMDGGCGCARMVIRCNYPPLWMWRQIGENLLVQLAEVAAM